MREEGDWGGGRTQKRSVTAKKNFFNYEPRQLMEKKRILLVLHWAPSMRNAPIQETPTKQKKNKKKSKLAKSIRDVLWLQKFVTIMQVRAFG